MIVDKNKRVLVTGGGGFIGHHLIKTLVRRGYHVRGVELVDMVATIAGKRIFKQHDLTKPQGVRGRNSDNARLRQVLGWEPEVSLEEGLTRTYRWIEVSGRLSQLAFS